MKKALLIFLGASLTWISPSSGEDPTKGNVTLTELTLKLAAELQSANAPIVEFESKYEAHLQKSLQQFQQRGELEKLMLLKKELETFRDNQEIDYSSFPELKASRSVYTSKRLGIKAVVVAERERILKRYLPEFAGLKQSLTQSGDLESALLVAAEEKKIDEMIQAEKLELSDGVSQQLGFDTPKKPTLAQKVIGTWMKEDTRTRFRVNEDGTVSAPGAENKMFAKGNWTLQEEIVTLVFPENVKHLKFSGDDLLISQDRPPRRWTLRRLQQQRARTS